MALHYFESLREKSRKIDEGIDELSEIWKVPHLLVGGYGDYNEESKSYVGELKNSLTDTQAALKSLMNNADRPEDSDADVVNEFLEKSEFIYQDLREQCNNLEMVFSEYGYRYKFVDDDAEGMVKESDVTSRTTSLREENQKDMEIKEESKEYRADSPCYMDNSGVEFTPELSWKCKTKFRQLTNEK